MKVPVSWLNEFVRVKDAPESLASKLTSAGVKVEKLHRPGNGMKGVVVAEVLDIQPHPKADKLTVVNVTAGGGEVQVVCGAKNFSVKDRVPLATPGSVLPGGGVIEARPFKGVTSGGMLCSAKELALGDDHSGILVLGPDAEVGRDVREVLGLPDAVFELEINPNRPDLMGIVGVAREVAAVTGEELAELQVPRPETQPDALRRRVEDLLTVEVEEVRGCPRYVARVIDGVEAAQSPAQVQYRLMQSGFRPISAVVDATNYALLVTGQPLHAFDLDRLEGQTIVVRRAVRAESMTMIDGEERALDSEDLVIADSGRPVALAGVMGGLDSEVTESTSRVALESAYFDPVSIFRTESRHGLRTEASARFERGVDPNNVELASALATSLITSWAGGKVASGVIDLYPEPVVPSPVSMRVDRARELLGVDWSEEEMLEALERLHLGAELRGGVILSTPPTYRVDLKAEEDLIEEVARIVGYERIPFTLPAGRWSVGRLPERERSIRALKRALVGAGVYEAITSSFCGPTDLEMLGLDERSAVAISNPLTRDDSLLRPSLLPNLLRSLALNFSRRPGDVRLFEIGKVFLRASPGPPLEPGRLGIVMGGPIRQEWHTPARHLDFFDLKGVLERVIDEFNVPDVTFADHGKPPYHQTRSSEIRSGDNVVGLAGQVGPDLAAKLDLPYAVYICELDLDALLAVAIARERSAELARFPAVYLDLAIQLPEGVKAGDVLAAARRAGGELLEDVRLIDVYRGQQVAEGNKSLAFTLMFRSPDRTLTEAEALVVRDAIAAAISKEYGGSIRS